ncbi:MAG: hypothetical protein RBU30_13560, partial [Polyangia bacterium]|nr:hypothetical protein [Polyangia bacterium]
AVRVHTQVNATSDPALKERLLTGDLNWVQPSGFEELQQVFVPVVFHDEERRVFALVLPEAYRSRELEERACLLQRLARDGGLPVPGYVVHFDVAYGEAGLSALLLGQRPDASSEPQEANLASREEEIVTREARLAEWQARIEAEQQRLAVDLKQRQLLDDDVNTAFQAEMRRREADMSRREAELREVERLVNERQAELDVREAHLKRQPLPAPGDTESITRVAHRESLELAARQSEETSDEGDLLQSRAPAKREEDEAAWSPDEELRKAQRELQARLGPSFVVGDPEGEAGRGDGMATAPLDLGEAPQEEPPADPTGALGLDEEAERVPELDKDEQALIDSGEEDLETPSAFGVTGPDLKDPWAEVDGSDTGTSRAFVSGMEGARLARSQETVATPLDADLLQAVAEEASKLSSGQEVQGDSLASPEPEGASEEELSPEVPPLPEELEAWYDDEKRGPRWYMTEQGVHLAVCLPAAEAEAFVGLEPMGLIQLHLFDSFAWITIAVVASGEDHSPRSIHWPLDVRDNRALALLDRLAMDFRFALEIYDDLLEPVTSQELHYPLEENVRVIRERAQLWLTKISSDLLDPVEAWEAFEEPGYHRVELGELELDPGAFQQLSSAVQVDRAVSDVARWSVSDKEDELLLRRSFPASSWRSLRLKALRAAIEYGIWMDADLRRIALEAGYATSKRDLLRACLSGFERVCSGELKGGLEAGRAHENWQAMFEEAEALGVAVEPRWEQLAKEAHANASAEERGTAADAPEGHVYTDQLERLEEADLVEADDLLGDPLEQGVEDEEGGETRRKPADGGEGDAVSPTGEASLSAASRGRSFSMGDLEEMSPQELMAMLGDAEVRLSAALELGRRGERRALPELFGLLGALETTEMLRLAPSLVGLGLEVAPRFIELLRSSSSQTRTVSALALGALGASEGIDGLIDLLLDEPTDNWRSVALALGDFGRPSMMSLASRIRHSSAGQRERLALALAEVSLRDGCRELLMDLSGSRDEEAAMLAVEALRKAAELREQREYDEPLPRHQPQALFTRRLLALLGPQDRDLGEDDIIEADDIVEEGDELS